MCRNGAQKLLGVLITVGEAVAYVVSGMYGDVRELGAGNAILIIVQVRSDPEVTIDPAARGQIPCLSQTDVKAYTNWTVESCNNISLAAALAAGTAPAFTQQTPAAISLGDKAQG